MDGNLPTTPWASNIEGRGPAWSNSLFEDNAEFGLGMRLTINKQRDFASELLKELSSQIGENLVLELLQADQTEEIGIITQRQRVRILREALKGIKDPRARHLDSLADSLVKKSVWIMGGDGWAYDIGYGGLDHVLASGLKCQCARSGHRSIFKHGRTGQQSHTTCSGCKICSQWQRPPPQGSGASRHDLWLRIRCLGSNGSQRPANLEGQSLRRKHMKDPLDHRYSHCIAHGFDLKKVWISKN